MRGIAQRPGSGTPLGKLYEAVGDVLNRELDRPSSGQASKQLEIAIWELVMNRFVLTQRENDMTVGDNAMRIDGKFIVQLLSDADKIKAGFEKIVRKVGDGSQYSRIWGQTERAGLAPHDIAVDIIWTILKPEGWEGDKPESYEKAFDVLYDAYQGTLGQQVGAQKHDFNAPVRTRIVTMRDDQDYEKAKEIYLAFLKCQVLASVWYLLTQHVEAGKNVRLLKQQENTIRELLGNYGERGITNAVVEKMVGMCARPIETLSSMGNEALAMFNQQRRLYRAA